MRSKISFFITFIFLSVFIIFAPDYAYAETQQASEYVAAENVELTPDGHILSNNDSTITYSFNIPEDGEYNILVRYKAVLGGGEILRRIYINSEIPFKEAENIPFSRFYADKNKDYKEQQGNQTFPPQVEVERFTELNLTSSNAFDNEPLSFFMNKGVNEITIESIESAIVIDTVSVVPKRVLPNYSEYYQNLVSSGAQRISGFEVRIQAEDATYKSSPGLYPINDRTSPLTEPYHPSYIVLNTIGGTAWRFPSQSIEWEIDVPEDGLYQIAFKSRQSSVRGMFTTRILSINGEVPFAQANDLRFDFDTDFSIDFFSDRETGEPFFFYLKKGKNMISLEASMGVFGEITQRVEESVKNLNLIYQDIIVITSSTPDKYRDYQLYLLLPDMTTRMRAERNRLAQVVDDITTISNSFASSTATINRLIVNLDKIIGNQMEIASYLEDFKSSISALGNWVVSISEQPLELDFFIVASEGTALPRARANFFERVIHSIRAFIGSFITNFESDAIGGNSAKTIEVWVSTGRDQYNVLKQLISESFNENVNVNLKLVNADTIFPATLTGNGPDVNLQVTASTPINFGYRGGAYDLAQFPDFEEVAARFSPAAVETFSFRDSCYALPDQMTFNMLFFRTDIFESLALEVPRTMDEFLAIVPILQKNNMDIYFATGQQANLGAVASMGSTRNINPVYAAFLYQMGGELYANDGEYSLITSEQGIKAFKFWTELYTKHNFIVQTSFETRFRMGEIPIGIVDFSAFNTLAAAAPEIKGDWEMAQIPGIVGSDGTVRYDNPLTVSGSLIVKNIAERKNTVEESWEFLKWWTSADVQYQFAVNMEAVLGLAGRYSVANLEAFERIPWGRNNLEVLKESLKWARAVPQVPGSYITGRVIDNAFMSVITESTNANPTDAIYKALEQLNEELASKRKEFGIE